jgi:hypothetical protein
MGVKENSQQTKLLEASYAKRDYKAVKEMILKNKNQFSLAQFHYNFGTLYAKEGELHISRYHLQKALKLGGIKKEVFQNLKYVETKLGFDEEGSAVYSIVDLPPSIFLILTLVFLIFSALLLKIEKLKKIKVGIVLICISFIPYLGSVVGNRVLSGAINIGDGEIRGGPSHIYEKTLNVPAGRKLIIGEIDKGWCRILYPLEFAGWIEKKSLGVY